MIPIHILCGASAARDALAALIAPRFGVPARFWCSAEDFLDDADSLDATVLLIDLDTPGTEAAIELLRSIQGDPRFASVVVTGSGTIPAAVEIMRAGAETLIEQPWCAEMLGDALEAACIRVARAGAMRDARERIGRLSPRERDVLDGLLLGSPNKTIARALGISPRTIESYRASLMNKLEVESLAEALRLALAAGFIPEADEPPGQLAA